MTEKTNEIIIDEDVKTDDSEINKIIIDSERELEKLIEDLSNGKQS